uniref:Uncharacterized protein n=1 Tax=Plectus sambesii TaxID=2011161 RepID=A0A914UMA1_9BILA
MHRSTKTPRTPPEHWIRDEDEQERNDSPVPDDPSESLPKKTSTFQKNRRPRSISAASRPDSTDSLSRSHARPERKVIHTEDDLRSTRQRSTRTPPAAPKTAAAAPKTAPAPLIRPSTTASSVSRSRMTRTRNVSPDSDDSSAERYRRYSNRKYYDWRSEDSDDESAHRKGHAHNGKNCELCNFALNGPPKRRPLTIEQLSLKSKSKPARPASIVVRQRSLSDGDPCDFVDTFVKKRKDKRIK